MKEVCDREVYRHHVPSRISDVCDCRSLLQDIVSFIGLFCKRDLSFSSNRQNIWVRLLIASINIRRSHVARWVSGWMRLNELIVCGPSCSRECTTLPSYSISVSFFVFYFCIIFHILFLYHFSYSISVSFFTFYFCIICHILFLYHFSHFISVSFFVFCFCIIFHILFLYHFFVFYFCIIFRILFLYRSSHEGLGSSYNRECTTQCPLSLLHCIHKYTKGSFARWI